MSDSGSDPGSTNPNDPSDAGTSDDATRFFPVSASSGTLNQASGNPPRLPSLGPIYSDLLSNYLTAPGPIYSGSPIGNPVSLESNRPITGGFGLYDNDWEVCGCPEVIEEVVDPCCEPVDPCSEVPIQEVIIEQGCCYADSVDSGGLVDVASEEVAEQIDESVQTDGANSDPEVDDKLGLNESVLGPSFLKRFGAWLTDPNRT